MATSLFADDSRSGGTMAEMNITPLVDVMLVLLIIFMVAAPIATRSLDLRLPQAPTDDQPRPPRMLLHVQADGSYRFDGTVMTGRTLQAALASVAHGAPNTVVEIDASDRADYQAFTAALAAARNSGIRNIALAR